MTDEQWKRVWEGYRRWLFTSLNYVSQEAKWKIQELVDAELKRMEKK